MEIKEDEFSPVQRKSYVDELLEFCRYKGETKDVYLTDRLHNFIEDQYTDWLQGFCKELEILRDMSKIVNEQVEYLKNKHKQ